MRSAHRAALATPVRPARRFPIRLDLLTNPYGPSVAALDAVAGPDAVRSPDELVPTLLHSLSDLTGLPRQWFLLANGVDELVLTVMLWRRGAGPLLLFPPFSPVQARLADLTGFERLAVRRSRSFAIDLDPDLASDLPATTTALVDSPNDPTGALLGPNDAVRLSRACEVVVVDERHAGYSARTMLPFVREFNNLLVLQTFETWAGLSAFPLAFAVGPPRLLASMAAYAPRAVGAAAVAAAQATIDDVAFVRGTVRRVREERGRLYRMLRKLNLTQPLPSLANFLLVEVTRGEADAVASELDRRGIVVHRLPQPELSRFLRVSAGFPDETDALKAALVEIAREIS